MRGTLLTYNQARDVYEKNEKGFFLNNTGVIDGYKYEMFSYKIAPPDVLFNPLEDVDINALEMRGITYIFNEDNSLYKRYLMLTKFFNVNQVEQTFYGNIKDKRVRNVMNKEDGSFISFVKFPNGKVLAKSKMSFESEQAIEANRIYNSNENIYNLVNWGLDNDINLFFEYVSFSNRIVLNYKETKLILLRGRDNKTGKLVEVDEFDTMGVDTTHFEDISLEDAVSLSKTLEGKEGWVFRFEDDMMVKQKTDWYFKQHQLFTESLAREDHLIEFILDEKIDDIISQLDPNEKERREFINNIINIVESKFSKIYEEVSTLSKEYKGDRKEFAIKYNKHEYFSILVNVCFRGVDIFESIKKYIRNKTDKLEKARDWLKE